MRLCPAGSGDDGTGLAGEARPAVLSPRRALCCPGSLRGARALRSDLKREHDGAGQPLLATARPPAFQDGFLPSALAGSGKAERSGDLGDPGFGVGGPIQFSSRLLLFSLRRGRWSVRSPCDPDRALILAWKLSGYITAVTFTLAPGIGDPRENSAFCCPLEQIPKAPEIEPKSPNLSPASCSPPPEPNPQIFIRVPY